MGFSFSDRKRVREELQATGQWRAYVELRDKLKAEGMPAKDAGPEAYKRIKDSQPSQLTWGAK